MSKIIIEVEIDDAITGQDLEDLKASLLDSIEFDSVDVDGAKIIEPCKHCGNHHLYGRYADCP